MSIMNNINISTGCLTTSIYETENKNENQREKLLITKLIEFFSYTPHLEQLLQILLKKSVLSLRILDYFITDYSKTYNISYNINLYGKNRKFFPYSSYKSQLDAFHKKLFDPFCRRERIILNYKNDYNIETTIGQLNFFKWSIQNNILDYVEQHIKEIQSDMILKKTDKKTIKDY